MKISVIIPVYNAASYLKACLDSLFAATKTLEANGAAKSEGEQRRGSAFVEVICVDDGSTDGSGAVLEDYQQKVDSVARLRLNPSPVSFKVIHQPNLGVSAARNVGMAAATGDLVTFLDSDDTYDPRALEVLAKVWMETGAEVIRYGCNLVKDHAKDVLLNENPTFVEVDINAEVVSPLKRCALGAATAISRRLAKTVVWPSLSQCEDPIFVLRCLQMSKKSVFSDGKLVNYLIRSNSASHAVSLKIVTATCRYLVMAYDECATMPGFAQFRYDTCSFLSMFLNGPLAGCGNDVPSKDRMEAERAVAEARTKLFARDGLFRLLTRREHFDLVFSLGAACSGTETLRDAKLQLASFPFDWLLGPGPLARAKMLASEFKGWLDDAVDFEEISNPDAFKHMPYRNRRTGYSYLHDFAQGASLEAQLPAVREKYNRRAARLHDLLGKAKRVLVVWTGDPRDKERLSGAELSATIEVLRARFPSVSFQFQVFECVEGIPASNPQISAESNVLRIAFDYRDPAAGFDWAIRRELLLPYLSGLTVTDYRTPELRRAHVRAERARDRERFPAKTYLGYVLTKLEFKLYKHLKKTLARRGVWMEQ